MKLKQFLRKNKKKKKNTFVLMFDENNELKTYEIDYLGKTLLEMEVMDKEETEDYVEVWVK